MIHSGSVFPPENTDGNPSMETPGHDPSTARLLDKKLLQNLASLTTTVETLAKTVSELQQQVLQLGQGRVAAQKTTYRQQQQQNQIVPSPGCVQAGHNLTVYRTFAGMMLCAACYAKVHGKR